MPTFLARDFVTWGAGRKPKPRRVNEWSCEPEWHDSPPPPIDDLLARNPEWNRRLRIHRLAREFGLEVPQFALMQECLDCFRPFVQRDGRMICPKCRKARKRSADRRRAS